MKRILNNMLQDIELHNRSKDQLLTYYIQKRLDKSLKSYYQDLTNSYNGLITHNEINVLNKLNKEK